MKKNIQKMSRFTFVVVSMLFMSTASAQWAGGLADCFLAGVHTQVGISRCGSFGSAAAPPAGYYRNAALPGIGFTCDGPRNGWLTAGPAGFPPYCGDYFLPGSPMEGFAIQMGASTYINANTSSVCASYVIPGTITSYAVVPGRKTGIWTGTCATGPATGLQVINSTIIPDSATYHVTQVQLCNTTAAMMRDIYYLRQVDPDNDQPWGAYGGSYTTDNIVLSQGSLTTDAVVTATGRSGCYLGLGTRYPNSRVARGGFFITTPLAVYNGTAPYSGTVGVMNRGDEAIALCIKVDSIPPGACECFGYAYILDASDLGRALDATVPVTMLAGTVDITDSLRTYICLYSGTVLRAVGPPSYSWTWSPGTGLSRTTGDTVYASPLATTTYTAVGTGPCGRDTFRVTVIVDSSAILYDLFSPARTDTNICRGANVRMNATTGAISYSWSPTTGLSPTTGSSVLATPTTSTMYKVTMRSPIGCTKTDSFLVNVDSVYMVLRADTTICPGSTVNISPISFGPSRYTLAPWTSTTSWTSSGPSAGTFLSTVPSARVSVPRDSASARVLTYVNTFSINGGLCSASDAVTINVNATPVVDITSLDSIYCISEPTDVISANLRGGVFSGPGIIDSFFNPSTAGRGRHQIVYRYVSPPPGCISYDTAYTYVDTIPVARISGAAPQYCYYDSSVALTGLPVGGTFSGSGVFGNRFYPILCTPGTTSTIVYSYLNPISGCADNDTFLVRINPRPTINFTGLDPQYCVYASRDTLTPIPTGGSFSGPGVSGNFFNPSLAGVGGSYNIIYNYTDPLTGCVNADTERTVVNARPIVSYTGLNSSYCIYNSSATLTGIPAGGLFSGPGMVANSFVPSNAGVGGPYFITYTYTNPSTGCVNIDSQSTRVNPRPTLDILGLDSQYCIHSMNDTLRAVPSGGLFSGTAMSGNIFSPGTAGIGGYYSIYYDYTDPTTTCVNRDTGYTRVLARPVVSFTGLDLQYCYYANLDTLTGIPSGGSFRGIGVASNTFNPSTATIGSRVFVTYAYTDPATGCFNQDSQATDIRDRPSVSFSGLDTQYCFYAPAATLTGSPAGGLFSGPGIVGTSFNPSIPGVGGPYQIIYTYSSASTGCTNADTHYVRVNPRPTIDFTGLDSQYCFYDRPVTLTGIPLGGAFSGPGVSGITFTPSVPPIGTHQVIYTYVNPITGCINWDTSNVRINNRPTVSFTGLNTQYCFYDSPDTLTGIPSGGAFSGIGMSSNIFNPSVPAVGSSPFVTYTYTDPSTGCLNNDSISTLINDRPAISITGLAASYCIDAAIAPLSGTPPAGTFSGTGITGSSFNPATAGVGGPYTITYTATLAATGCQNTTTLPVRVNPLPTPTFTGLDSSYCFYEPVSFLNGSPLGGTFSGPGISGNTFNPATAGVGGPFSIIYDYTDLTTTCRNRDTQYVTVNSRPVINITGLSPNYCIYDAPVTLNGTPAGGRFFGPGITGNVFSPATLAAGGPYFIKYEFTDPATGCYNIDSVSTNVRPLPTPSYTGLNPEYCLDAPAVTLTGSPAGGVFSGPGISGTSFIPSTAGAGGPYRIEYRYADGFGCINVDTQFTIVNPLPPASAGSDDSICLGTLGTLTATGGIRYVWSPGGYTSAGIFVSPANTTTFTVTVTDAKGCSATDQATVHIRKVEMDFATKSVSCFRYDDGFAVALPTLGRAPFSYQWNDPFNQRSDTARNLLAGTYICTVTDYNGCIGIDTVVVTQPAEFRFNISSSNLKCFSDNTGSAAFTGFGGTPPYSYRVINDSGFVYSGQILSGLPAGNYYVTATDFNGCEALGSFTLSQPTRLILTYEYNNPRCYGYTDGYILAIALGGTPGYSYEIDGRSVGTNSWIDGLGAGIHTITLQDSNGCTQTAYIPMTQPDPILVNINPDTLRLELGETGQFITSITGAPLDSVSFYWSPADGLSCPDCPNPFAGPYTDRTYELTVIDRRDFSNPNPCRGTAIGYVIVGGGPPIYVPNAFSPNGDGVNDEFLVYGSGLKSITMLLFDRWGEKIFETGDIQTGWDGYYKGVLANPGVYTYVLDVEYLNGIKTSKTGSVTVIR